MGRVIRERMSCGSSSNMCASVPMISTTFSRSCVVDLRIEVPTISMQTTSGQQTGGTSNLLQSVQYRKTGIILEISPTVYSDDRIDLDLDAVRVHLEGAIGMVVLGLLLLAAGCGDNLTPGSNPDGSEIDASSDGRVDAPIDAMSSVIPVKGSAPARNAPNTAWTPSHSAVQANASATPSTSASRSCESAPRRSNPRSSPASRCPKRCRRPKTRPSTPRPRQRLPRLDRERDPGVVVRCRHGPPPGLELRQQPAGQLHQGGGQGHATLPAPGISNGRSEVAMRSFKLGVGGDVPHAYPPHPSSTSPSGVKRCTRLPSNSSRTSSFVTSPPTNALPRHCGIRSLV